MTLLIEKLPTLFGRTKTNKIKKWEIVAVQTDLSKAIIKTSYGLLDGEITVNEKNVSRKNIGKSNETSHFEQAVLEAKSLWRSKKDEGYAESIDDLKEPSEVDFFLPMLAEDFDEKKEHLKFPLYSQPKYDGCRLLSKKENGEVKMWSRKGKLITIPVRIKESLQEYLEEGQCADGELYVHGWKFQRIVSAVKEYKEDTDKLQYYIYDSPILNMSFEERFVNSFKKEMPKNLVKSETCLITCMEDALEQLDVYLRAGFEGQMLRNSKSLYQYKYRSNDLQKMKTFVDAEYVVVGVEEAQGRDIGTAVFICETENKQIFKVRPKGTLEERKEYLDNFDEKYLGKKLTVKYQEKTDDGIPRFPVGLRFRPEWDLGT